MTLNTRRDFKEIEMMSPKTKKTISAVIVIGLILAMVLTMVLPYIVR
jgi:hypothetical protein